MHDAERRALPAELIVSSAPLRPPHALRSHQRAAKAWAEGFYDDLVMPVVAPPFKEGFREDNIVRKDYSPWRDQVRRMQRTDPVYKPALLLVVIDMIEEGLATPDWVPLQQAMQRFDELLVRAKLIGDRGPGRGMMPAFHLSTSSDTREPFWDLVREGTQVGKLDRPSQTSKHADGLRVLPDLAFDLADGEGREAVRHAIYRMLEDDPRSDCGLILAAHDVDKPDVDDRTRTLVDAEGKPFVLDDADARRTDARHERVVRDRALRLAVLPTYGYSCALCSTRLRWNSLFEAEAAHIKPRSRRGSDDVRNALALCQTHHWAFDLGLWSATDELVVLVRKADAKRGDDLDAIRPFEGKPLRPPDRETARPHPLALEWHRDVRFRRAA